MMSGGGGRRLHHQRRTLHRTIAPSTTPTPAIETASAAAATTAAAPTTIQATEVTRAALLHDRIERLAKYVSDCKQMLFRIKGITKESVPLYDHVPLHVDELSQSPVQIVEAETPLILHHPQHLGPYGVAFMAVPQCDAETGEVRLLYAPVHIPDSPNQNDAMTALAVSYEILFKDFELV